MEQTWIVLLEAEGDSSESPIDLQTLRTLMATMAGDHVVAIHSPYRYGLQLQIVSTSPARALFAATSRWEAALRRLGLPTWALQRVELLTPEEFARDFALPDGAAPALLSGSAEPTVGEGPTVPPDLVLLQGGRPDWTPSASAPPRSRRRARKT